jgi:hypothetical protein
MQPSMLIDTCGWTKMSEGLHREGPWALVNAAIVCMALAQVGKLSPKAKLEVAELLREWSGLAQANIASAFDSDTALSKEAQSLLCRMELFIDTHPEPTFPPSTSRPLTRLRLLLQITLMPLSKLFRLVQRFGGSSHFSGV